jgi:3-hydroxybutyryl-CoA dehydrogenase
LARCAVVIGALRGCCDARFAEFVEHRIVPMWAVCRRSIAVPDSPDMAAVSPTSIIGIVGAGTMGGGIAEVAATAGHPVLVVDTAADAAEAAIKAARERLTRSARKGRLSEDAARAAGDRLRAAASIADLAPCALVVEAVVEELGVKRALFAELEASCDGTAILATNTSSLDVTEIAAGLAQPERVAGMHFFNPAPVLPLVEVVAAAQTDPAVLDTLTETAQAWGKTPVRCASTPGFIVNRVARPFYGEAFRLLEAGVAEHATIDALFREAGGFRMGPFELTDLIGQDVNVAVSRRLWEAFDHDPRFEPSALQASVVAEGRLGRKSGRGIYDSDRRPEPETAPPALPPGRLVVNGAGDPLDALVTRLAEAGVPAVRTMDFGPVRLRPAPGIVLRLTDGRTAANVSAAAGETVALIDLAHDYASATRVGLAPPSDAPTEAVNAAVGCLQAAGLSVTVLPDVAALVVARTVAMLAAFGADAVETGVASAADVDTAMRLGVNYPRGPIEWGDGVGWNWVEGVLAALAAAEDPSRYRIPDGVRRRAVRARG